MGKGTVWSVLVEMHPAQGLVWGLGSAGGVGVPGNWHEACRVCGLVGVYQGVRDWPRVCGVQVQGCWWVACPHLLRV